MTAGYRPTDDSALTWADLSDDERREYELRRGACPACIDTGPEGCGACNETGRAALEQGS